MQHNRTIATRTPALSDETIVYSTSTSVPPALREEKQIPTLSLHAKLIGNRLSIRGTSRDESELESTTVYVNGIKVSLSGSHSKWSTSIQVDKYREDGPFKADSLTIIVLSKDQWGNAAVTMDQLEL